MSTDGADADFELYDEGDSVSRARKSSPDICTMQTTPTPATDSLPNQSSSMSDTAGSPHTSPAGEEGGQMTTDTANQAESASFWNHGFANLLDYMRRKCGSANVATATESHSDFHMDSHIVAK